MKITGRFKRSGRHFILYANPKPVVQEIADVVVKAEILCDPPVDKCYVTNVYVDPETGKLNVEYDDIPKGSDGGRVQLLSNPPRGMCRVKNLFWDPKKERLSVEYDDQPIS